VCSTYTPQYIEHQINHRAGTQRLRTNEIERDIDARVCRTYTLQYIEHQMNHKAGTQRLRRYVIERGIDYSCVQYTYTTVYRTSDDSQGEETEVTYQRN
jgi:SOS response regulatory protein OraA/RecX